MLDETSALDEAIKALAHGIELKPHYAEADARLLLAESFLAAGQKRTAIEQWKIIVNLASEYPSYEKPIDEAKQQLKIHGDKRRAE